VIVAVAAVETAVVLIVKLAVLAPAATVTLDGTVAAASSLDSVTDMPPTGATPLNVTVPVEEPPPVTDTGFVFTDTRAGGLIVSEAVCVPL
jgi:hypothetical protein